jgi:hypothetical protein
MSATAAVSLALLSIIFEVNGMSGVLGPAPTTDAHSTKTAA